MLADLLVNPHRDLTLGVRRVAPAWSFHRGLSGYAAAPLVELPQLASRLGVGTVLAKIEGDRFGLPAFKALGASWALARALARRSGADATQWSSEADLLAGAGAAGRPLVVTATDGNHGRAVARMARLAGLAATVLMPAGSAPARIVAIEQEGAEVVVIEGDYDAAVEMARQAAAADGLLLQDTFVPGHPDPPVWVVEGYATLFRELDEQLSGRTVDAVLVPVGVGALACAAVRHFATSSVVAVEPADAACVLASLRAGHPVTTPGPHRSVMAGLNCGTPCATAWPELLPGLAGAVAITDDAACAAMREFADNAIVAGETGAASLGALLGLADRPSDAAALGITRNSTVLLLVTEGATDPDHYAQVVGRSPQEVASA